MAERELRKQRSNLVVSGTAVIFFGIWSVAKTILILTSASGLAEIEQEMHEQSAGRSGQFYIILSIIFYILLAIILALDLSFRLYIGLCAISDGKQTKRRRVYTVFAVIFAGISAVALIISIVTSGSGYFFNENGLLDALITLMVEMASIGAMSELAVSSIRVHRLEKRLAAAR